MAYVDHVKGLTYTTADAIQIVLPTITYNILNAASQVSFMAGNFMTTFAPSEHITIGDFDQISYSLDPTAPAWNIDIIPLSAPVIELFTDPAAQASPIRYWSLIVNDQTGEVMAHKLMWNGRINTQVVTLGEDTQKIAIETVTANDLLMRPSESQRLTTAWHQHCFGPNVMGLANNDSASENPYWGAEPKSNPTGGSSTGGGGFSFGGVNIGGGGGSRGPIIDMINQNRL